MKLCGHTMGMPEMDIFESISFCAEIGLEGIEVRCADNGQMHLEALDADNVGRIREQGLAHGVEFACLTPYYRNFMDDEATEASLDGYRTACAVAAQLDCPTVRAISGQWPQEDHEREEVFERTVEGTREAGAIAARHGVVLGVETHRGQLAWSATEALEFVEAVDHEAVGVLYDAYWVHVRGEESADEAMEMLAPWIVHVHAKDCARDTDGSTHTTLIGAGEMDWEEIIEKLRDIGYDGWISDEYEKFWHPERLPDPEEGMRHNAQVLRRYIARA